MPSRAATAVWEALLLIERMTQDRPGLEARSRRTTVAVQHDAPTRHRYLRNCANLQPQGLTTLTLTSNNNRLCDPNGGHLAAGYMIFMMLKYHGRS